MTLERLSEEDRKLLYQRYCKNDLFRQWSPILAQIERQYGGIDSTSLWYHAENILYHLRCVDEHRDAMIPEIYNRLYLSSNELTAVSIMTIVYLSIANAVEKGHEDEAFPNRPMCIAIINMLRDNKIFISLTKAFFANDTGNDGKKVVIKRSDPMLDSISIDDMSEEVQKEINITKNIIINRTQNLQTLFKKHWPAWISLWDKILVDDELTTILHKKEPRTTTWGINEKMVCNVLGLFNQRKNINCNISELNSTLFKKNNRSYISNHTDFNGTDSSLLKEQHVKIENMIKEL